MSKWSSNFETVPRALPYVVTVQHDGSITLVSFYRWIFWLRALVWHCRLSFMIFCSFVVPRLLNLFFLTLGKTEPKKQKMEKCHKKWLRCCGLPMSCQGFGVREAPTEVRMVNICQLLKCTITVFETHRDKKLTHVYFCVGFLFKNAKAISVIIFHFNISDRISKLCQAGVFTYPITS